MYDEYSLKFIKVIPASFKEIVMKRIDIKKCPFCQSANFKKINFSELNNTYPRDLITLFQSEIEVVQFCSDCNKYLACYESNLNELSIEVLRRLEEGNAKIENDVEKEMIIIVTSDDKLSCEDKNKIIHHYINGLRSLKEPIIINVNNCQVITTKNILERDMLQADFH